MQVQISCLLSMQLELTAAPWSLKKREFEHNSNPIRLGPIRVKSGRATTSPQSPETMSSEESPSSPSHSTCRPPTDQHSPPLPLSSTPISSRKEYRTTSSKTDPQQPQQSPSSPTDPTIFRSTTSPTPLRREDSDYLPRCPTPTINSIFRPTTSIRYKLVPIMSHR